MKKGTNTTERYFRSLSPAGRAASLLPFRFLLETDCHQEMKAKRRFEKKKTNRDSRAVRSAIVSGRVSIEASVHWL